MINDKFKLYYSVCQYIPNPIRQEAMNVGIVFHIPSKKYSKFYHIRGTKRLIAFDDECNKDFINMMYKSLKYIFDMCDKDVTEDVDERFEDIASDNFLLNRTKYFVNAFQFLDVASIYTNAASLEKDIEVLKKTYLYYDYNKKARITDRKLSAYIVRQLKMNNVSQKIGPAQLKTATYVPKILFEFQNETEFIKVMTMNYSRPDLLSNKFKIFIYDLLSVKDKLNNKKIRIVTDDNDDLEYTKMINEFVNEIQCINKQDHVRVEKATSYINELSVS